ncbi:hypothetical protein NHX12_020256 [Muraenolepis orangiensis]|uniref:Uncharacterized protein n=1 Tax=Muraenolepis orangiensis TaxID=630683 RepID=A0A9Q0ER09_9TELE|nr:hypothetical protein NHX12_020256 [Muraenolepis orangiensis]
MMSRFGGSGGGWVILGQSDGDPAGFGGTGGQGTTTAERGPSPRPRDGTSSSVKFQREENCEVDRVDLPAFTTCGHAGLEAPMTPMYPTALAPGGRLMSGLGAQESGGSRVIGPGLHTVDYKSSRGFMGTLVPPGGRNKDHAS